MVARPSRTKSGSNIGEPPPQQEREGIRYGPRFKDQCANAQNVPTDRGSPDPDPASPEAEAAGQQTQTTGQPLPVTAQVVDDQEIEEQIRRRIGEAQAVPPSQVQPLLPDNKTLTCKKAMRYVAAGLVLVGVVLGVVLPLTLPRGGGSSPTDPATNAPTEEPVTNAPSKYCART